MKKIILAIMIVLGLNGCAFSGTGLTVLGVTGGAVTAAENVSTVVKIIKEIEGYFSEDHNATKELR